MPDLHLDEGKALEAVEQRHWQLLRWCNKNGLDKGLSKIEQFIQKCQAVRDTADRLDLHSVVLDCDDRIWYWSIKESYVTHKVRHRIPVLRYRCDSAMKIKSHAEFEQLSAWGKGYAVYVLGERNNEPYVPKTYAPSAGDRKEYEQGQQAAYIEVLDTEG